MDNPVGTMNSKVQLESQVHQDSLFHPFLLFFCPQLHFAEGSLHMVGKVTVISHSQFSNFPEKTRLSHVFFRTVLDSDQCSLLLQQSCPGEMLYQYLYLEISGLGNKFIVKNRRMRKDTAGGKKNRHHTPLYIVTY